MNHMIKVGGATWQVLPIDRATFECLGCGEVFEHDCGPDVECPQCDHLYFERKD